MLSINALLAQTLYLEADCDAILSESRLDMILQLPNERVFTVSQYVFPFYNRTQSIRLTTKLKQQARKLSLVLPRWAVELALKSKLDIEKPHHVE